LSSRGHCIYGSCLGYVGFTAIADQTDCLHAHHPLFFHSCTLTADVCKGSAHALEQIAAVLGLSAQAHDYVVERTQPLPLSDRQGGSCKQPHSTCVSATQAFPAGGFVFWHRMVLLQQQLSTDGIVEHLASQPVQTGSQPSN
jgi:hypothetical protein